MVLWQKESGRADALFIDLFPSESDIQFPVPIRSFSYSEMLSELIPSKNDQNSTQLRESGNKKFGERNYLEAMEFYNQSLQFATVGSENISKSYANRSACFILMGKYDKCLKDIELAKKADYPPQLMSKLDERVAKCLKLMKKSTSKTIEKPTLSFEPDEKFPCMANVLQISSNDEFGKHIVAKEDIGVGEIILVEEAFVSDASRCAQTKCNNCLNFAMNFIPCPKCSDAMFCDAQCMESNRVHQLECSATYQGNVKIEEYLESICKAVAAFPSIEDLMEFVEKSLASRDFSSLQGVSDAQKKYGMFLKLLAKPKSTDLSNVRKAYKLLIELPGIPARLHSIQNQRFFVHLILLHIRIVQINSIAFGSSAETSISLLGNISSLFNHACYNNANMEICGNQIICYAVRPTKKGDQIFIQYRKGGSVEFTTADRQSVLRDMFEFECKCSMCVPCYKDTDCLKMQADPNYQFFTSSSAVQEFAKDKNTKIMKTKFCEFLNKYGHLPWCEEMEVACMGLDTVMRIELSQAFNFYELTASILACIWVER